MAGGIYFISARKAARGEEVASIKNKRSYLIFIALIVLLLGIGISHTAAYSQANRAAELRAESVLLDSAMEQATTLSTVIDGQFKLLDTIANHAALHATAAQEEIARVVSVLSERSGFSSIRYIDATGSMLCDDRAIDASEQEYFTAAMRGKRTVEYLYSTKNNIPAVAMSVPYVADGVIRGAICGWMYAGDIQKLIVSRAYGGAGYSLVIDANASVVVSSGSGDQLANDGTLSFLREAKLGEVQSYDGIIAKLQAGESFTFRYTYGGDSRIAAVAKLSDDRLPSSGWFILNAVSDEFLQNEASVERRNSLEQIYIVLLFSVIAYALLLVYQRGVRKELASFADSLRQREACFRAVAEQTGRFVFRYDVASDCYYQVTEFGNALGAPSVVQNFCESVLTWGLIAEESVATAKAMMSAVRRGETPPDTDLKLKTKTGEYRWFRFYVTPILDEHGNPESAVVAYMESSEQREREMAYSRWRQEMDLLPGKSMLLLEWNITQNIFESERGDARLSPSLYASATFDEVAQIYAERCVASEDRQAYLSLINRTHLLGLYHSNTVSAGLDYREVREDGACRWMRLTVRLVMYPTSTDVKAYIAARDVNEEKLAELALIAQAELDPLTGVYNRKAYIDRVTRLFESEPEQQHIFMMLDVDEFKRINDSFGHDLGDDLLKSFADNARRELRTCDIIGRTGGDEFMICIADMPSEAVMVKKAKSLIKAISGGMSGVYGTTVSMGIAVFPRDGSTFSELYKKADVALYRVKRTGKNNFCFYKKELDGGATEN